MSALNRKTDGRLDSVWGVIRRVCMLAAFAVNVICLLVWMEAICRHSYEQAVIWLLERTPYAAMSAGLIALVLAALVCLLGRAAPALTLGNAFFILLAIVSAIKLDLRGDPLQFSDIAMAREAVEVAGKMIAGGMEITREMALGLVLMVVLAPLAFWGVRVMRRRPALRPVCCAALCAACVPCLYLMASTQRAEYLVVMQDDYTRRGFLVAFADRLPAFDDSKNALSMPEEYGEEAVKEALGPYAGRGETPEILPNILFVMSESLTDAAQYFDLTQEPMPYLKQMQQEHWGGNFLAITYGGGTANVEYEVLTGYRLADTPWNGFNILRGLIRPEMSSLVSVLESYGYSTQAIHPNDGSYYDRLNVYETMGFDSTLFLNSLDPVPESFLLYPSDDYLFEQIIKAYENRPQGQPWFCHTVTFQNHGGYGFEADFGDIEVEGELEELDHRNIRNYVNMLKLSDDALRELIGYFDGQQEPTVIVVWGDHAPGISQFGMKLPDSPEQQMTYYNTPILIYSNFGLDASALPKQISAHRLGACVLSLLGMDSDAYLNYLGSPDAQNLTLFSGLMEKDGAFVFDPEAYEQEAEKLMMLHYDRLIGENYGEDL